MSDHTQSWRGALLALARAISDETGRGLAAMSIDICGQSRLFRRLEDGAGERLTIPTYVKARDYLLALWPADKPLPPEVDPTALALGWQELGLSAAAAGANQQNQDGVSHAETVHQLKGVTP